MKRIRLTLALLTAFCGAGVASHASAAGTVELNLGYTKSSTELGTTGESFGGGVGVGGAIWRKVSSTVSWGAEVSWDNLGEVKAQYDDEGTNVIETFSARVVRVNPAVRLKFGGVTGPSFFAQSGAGVYNIAWKYEYTDDSPSPPAPFNLEGSSSDLGLNFAAGLAFPMGPKTRMNISGVTHIVPKPDNTNVDDLNNYQLRAGLEFGL